MNKRALVTGAAGQDGSYLCELLLAEGWRVDALIRPSGEPRLRNLYECMTNPNFHMIYGDILDPHLTWSIADAKYDAVYHLAAMTHVMQSFQAPTLAMETNATATVALLHALHTNSRDTRFYFAATSEMFGGMTPPQKANETHQLGGHSPYAAAKIAAFVAAKTYRERGLFVVNGIGFNHESKRRGANFVTRKLGVGVRHYATDSLTHNRVTLGNLAAQRDWHHASDTMRGAYLAMQHHTPDDYVWASGVARSVEELARTICDYFDVKFDYAIQVSESERRPWDVDYLRGDAGKAKSVLGWEPELSWNDLIEDVCSP